MSKNKIKFLATGDIHSEKKLIENIKKYTKIEDIDFILLNGDLSEKKNDFKNILSIFKGKPILMVPGNHESKKQLRILEEKYNVHILGNKPMIISDKIAIFGSNYLNIGEMKTNEQNILDNLIENLKPIKHIKNKILLSHLPPSDSLIGDSSPFFPYIGGSEAVSVFLENFNIDLTLVGHIHETSGLEELVFNNKVLNVGRTSKIIEFDTHSEKINILN